MTESPSLSLSLSLSLALTCLAGAALGAIFFGGLWVTVRRGVSSPRPALWFFLSLLLRMSIALAGFYFVSEGRWQRLLLCLIGFVMARCAVTRLTQRSGDKPCALVPIR
jgi:F1F0 ATPase subunit 2